MKNTLFGYSQAAAIELGLNLEDLCILRWFEDFVKTEQMKTFDIDGQTYYWVKYDYVVKQITIIADNKRKMTTRFKRLVDLQVLDFVLSKNYGNFTLYKLNEENHKLLTKNSNNVLQEKVKGVTENGKPLLPNNVTPITKKGETLSPKTVKPFTEKGDTNINLSNINLSNNSSIKNKSIPARTNTSIGDIENFINASFENEQVREKIFLFLENCVSLGKSKNDNAVKMFVDKIKRFDDSTKIELLENAIINDWKDIFPQSEHKSKSEKSSEPLSNTSYDISEMDKMWDKVPSLI